MGSMYANHPGEQKHRGFTDHLWRDFPFEHIQSNPRKGMFLYDDFVQYDVATNGWTLTSLVGTATATQDGYPGIMTLDPGATTDTHGGSLQGDALWTPAADRLICFECLFKITVVTLNPIVMIGLVETDATPVSGAAEAIANGIVLYEVGGGGNTDDLDILGCKVSVNDINLNALVDYSTGEWHKFGIRIDGVSSANCYIDGVQLGTSFDIATANIPIVALCPTFVTVNDGTSRSTLEVDWVAVGLKDESDVIT